jgi:protein-S-isoprenylcysteine O-methyltransferase Ste14
MRENIAGSIVYRIPAIVGLLLLLDSYRLSAPLSTSVISDGILTSLLSVALSFIGLAICIWARFVLGRNWSSVVVVKKDHELIQSGPYRFVRHPIYTGMIMMFLANVLLSGRMGSLFGLICFVASFYLKLLREEKMMMAEFPNQYPNYCRRVRRLIPFIH